MSFAQRRALVVVTLISMVDGYDVLAASFAAPGVAAGFRLTPTDLGLLLSSGLLGMAVGSVLLAPLADLIGRRAVVIANLTLMAIALLMSGLSQTFVELVGWRALTGLGLGAVIPTIAPLAVEFANDRRRTLALSLMTIGYPAGATVGGVLAAVMIGQYGWRSVFFLGAALTAGLLVSAVMWLPEPLTHLLERRGSRSLIRVNKLLVSFGHPPVARLPAVDPARLSPFREVFSGVQRARTLRIAAANLLFVTSVYYILSWMPKLVADAGHGAALATGAAAVASLAGIATGLALGFLGRDRSGGALIASVLAMLGMAIPVFAMVASAMSLPFVMVAAAAVGVFLYGGTVCLFWLVVDSFEPRARATGAGVVLGVGRISAAAAPTTAGLLMSAGVDTVGTSAALGLPAIAAGAIALRIVRSR